MLQGSAFVAFKSPEGLKNALERNETEYGGRTIYVCRAGDCGSKGKGKGKDKGLWLLNFVGGHKGNSYQPSMLNVEDPELHPVSNMTLNNILKDFRNQKRLWRNSERPLPGH